jgi:hypothetical protein
VAVVQKKGKVFDCIVGYYLMKMQINFTKTCNTVLKTVSALVSSSKLFSNHITQCSSLSCPALSRLAS